MNARTVWRACLVCILAGLIGLVVVLQAAAHSFYEPRCCSGVDCYRLPVGAVRVTPQGYLVSIPGGKVHLVGPRDPRVRMIPEGASAEDAQYFHACTVGGRPDGMLLCLYVPSGGF